MSGITLNSGHALLRGWVTPGYPVVYTAVHRNPDGVPQSWLSPSLHIGAGPQSSTAATTYTDAALSDLLEGGVLYPNARATWTLTAAATTSWAADPSVWITDAGWLVAGGSISTRSVYRGAEVQCLLDGVVYVTVNAGGSASGAGITWLPPVATGGTVDLSHSDPVNTEVGLRVTGTTGTATVDGVQMPPGVYVLLRVTGGWEVRLLADPIATTSDVPPPPEDVEVAPATPSWDDVAYQAIIPTLTGVIYSDASGVVTGTVQYAAGQAVTITAAPAPEYVFPVGVASSWPHTFPAASAWTTAFSDLLTTPVGEVTSRTGYVITNPASGNNHLVISAAGLKATGSSVIRTNSLASAKHRITVEYGFTSGWEGGSFNVEAASNGYSHRISIIRNGSNQTTIAKMVVSLTNGAGTWTEWEPESGVDPLNLAPSGTLIIEADGTRVWVWVNGTLVGSGLYSANARSFTAAPQTGFSVSWNGVANTNDGSILKSILMETKP